jgi:hypothetical protein
MFDFDPRDHDSRDDERYGFDQNRGTRGSADDRDRDDDWSQPETRPRDRDDDEFIETALVGGAGIIVSGDRHLLVLGTVQGIEILTARQFVDRLAVAGPDV